MNRYLLLNFLPNIAIASSLLFIPIIAQNFGLSLFELGLIGSAYSIGSLISYYLFGWWSDRTGNRVGFVKIGLFVLAITIYSQVLMSDFFSMLVIRFFAGFAIGIFTFPLVAAVSELDGMKRKLAVLTSFGSLGWFVGQLAGGILQDFSLIFIAGAILCLISGFVALTFPKTRSSKVFVSKFPVSLIRKNLRLYLAVFLRHVGAWTVWIIFPLYLLSIGADIFWIGAISSINPLVQFFVMRFVGKITGRVREATIIKVGFLFAALTFVALSFTTHFLQVIFVELLLGVSWACIYTGSLIHLASNNNEKSTATALFGSTTRLSMVIGPIIGGSIAFLFGFRATMYFAVAACLVALFISRKL